MAKKIFVPRDVKCSETYEKTSFWFLLRCSTHFWGINNYKTNSHKSYSSLKSESNSGAPFFDDINASKLIPSKKSA